MDLAPVVELVSRRSPWRPSVRAIFAASVAQIQDPPDETVIEHLGVDPKNKEILGDFRPAGQAYYNGRVNVSDHRRA